MKRNGWVLSIFFGTIVGVIFAGSVGFQGYQLYKFMHAGARFTANDGKELCEHMNIIAMHSIGFQQSGLPLLDCKKYLRIGDKR
jgi:hypothetical protein